MTISGSKKKKKEIVTTSESSTVSVHLFQRDTTAIWFYYRVLQCLSVSRRSRAFQWSRLSAEHRSAARGDLVRIFFHLEVLFQMRSLRVQLQVSASTMVSDKNQIITRQTIRWEPLNQLSYRRSLLITHASKSRIVRQHGYYSQTRI